MNELKEPDVAKKRKRKRSSRHRDGPAPEVKEQLVQTPSDWKLSSDDEEPADSQTKQQDAATQSEREDKPSVVPKEQHYSSDVSIVRVGRQHSESSEQYDRVDLITTKTQKILKKRPQLFATQTDSDESAENAPMHRSHRSSKMTAPRAQPTLDGQQSDPANTPYMTTVSSSLLFSSSDSLPLNNDSSLTTLTRTLQPGRSLGSDLAFIYMVIPPDGGWGWIILVVSFLAQIIVDGIIFTIGSSFPYMAKDFEVLESTVVLISAVQLGCYFLAGTISTALINTWGFRPVALLGASLACVAISCATFSPNMAVMVLTYSVIGGIGLSMIWCSSQLIIGYYFEQYRPIASGFSCSGAGAGIVVFSLVNNELLPLIGWRNTTRVHAGCLVLVFIMTIAYIEVMPVPIGIWHKTEEHYASSSEEYYGTVHYFMRDTAMSLSSRPSLLDIYDPTVRNHTLCTRLCLCSSCCSCANRERRRATLNRQKEPARGTAESQYVVRRDPVQRQDLFYTGRAEYEVAHSTEIIEGRSMELVGSTKHMASAAYGLSHIHHEEPTVQKEPKSNKRSLWARLSPKNWLHAKIKRAFALLFDFRLLKQFEFRFLVASAFFFPMGFNIPFIYAKSRTTIPGEYAILIGPSIGATNFLVRIICGFIAYKYKQTSTMVCGCGLVFGGLIVFWSAFYGADLVWFQLTYGGCYGVAPAVFSTLRALLYVRYLGLRNLTNAFGITALAMGLGVFIGTTLGGLMNEFTGNFMLAFVFAGLCIIISGLLILVLPLSIKYRNARLAKRLRLPENYKHRQHTSI